MKIIYIPEKRLTAELPTVSISDPYDIGTTTFSCGGNVLSNGGSPLTAKGFVWGTSPNPTLANNIANAGNTNVTGFDIFFQYLSTNTTYYLRAFATNGVGTAYSTQKQVDTLAVVGLPAVFNITTGVPTTSSVRVIGEVTGTGGGTITQQGVCYNTTGNPATSDPKIQWTPTGIGMMDMDATGLTTNTTYYFRFFATNQVGTAYSPSFTVVTSNTVQLCTLSTGPINEITVASAEIYGKVNSFGGGTLQQAGFCFSTSPNPTTANSKVVVTGIQQNVLFNAPLTGLRGNTLYYVKVYAQNEAGIAYSDQFTFTTENGYVTFVYIVLNNAADAGKHFAGLDYMFTPETQYWNYPMVDHTLKISQPSEFIISERRISAISVPGSGETVNIVISAGIPTQSPYKVFDPALGHKLWHLYTLQSYESTQIADILAAATQHTPVPMASPYNGMVGAPFVFNLLPNDRSYLYLVYDFRE